MNEKHESAIEEATAMAVYLGVDPAVAAKELSDMAAQMDAINRHPEPAPVVSPLWSDILKNPSRKQKP